MYAAMSYNPLKMNTFTKFDFLKRSDQDFINNKALVGGEKIYQTLRFTACSLML